MRGHPRTVLSPDAEGRGGKHPPRSSKILHILRKPNSIIALLFIQNISPFLKEFRHFTLCFLACERRRIFAVTGYA